MSDDKKIKMIKEAIVNGKRGTRRAKLCDENTVSMILEESHVKRQWLRLKRYADIVVIGVPFSGYPTTIRPYNYITL